MKPSVVASRLADNSTAAASTQERTPISAPAATINAGTATDRPGASTTTTAASAAIALPAMNNGRRPMASDKRPRTGCAMAPSKLIAANTTPAAATLAPCTSMRNSGVMLSIAISAMV